jgi:hypothetical protein
VLFLGGEPQPASSRFQRYKLRDAAKDGRIITYKCLVCRCTTNFLAADLITIYSADQDAHDPVFKCSRCDSWDIFVSFRIPAAGDYGSLLIRRPGPVRKTQTWRTVKLGD